MIRSPGWNAARQRERCAGGGPSLVGENRKHAHPGDPWRGCLSPRRELRFPCRGIALNHEHIERQPSEGRSRADRSTSATLPCPAARHSPLPTCHQLLKLQPLTSGAAGTMMVARGTVSGNFQSFMKGS